MRNVPWNVGLERRFYYHPDELDLGFFGDHIAQMMQQNGIVFTHIPEYRGYSASPSLKVPVLENPGGHLVEGYEAILAYVKWLIISRDNATYRVA